MRHQWFTCVRLFNSCMTGLIPPFNRIVHHLPVTSSAAYGSLKSAPVGRLRWVYHHLEYSIARNLHAHSWHTSSRPVEFHHQPLTEPYLMVSHHTALHGDRVMLSRTQPLSVEVLRFLLVSQLTKTSHITMSSPSVPTHYRCFNPTIG